MRSRKGMHVNGTSWQASPPPSGLGLVHAHTSFPPTADRLANGLRLKGRRPLDSCRSDALPTPEKECRVLRVRSISISRIPLTNPR